MLDKYENDPGLDCWKAAKKFLDAYKERWIIYSLIEDLIILKWLDIQIQTLMGVLI